MFRKSLIAAALVLTTASGALAGDPSDDEFPEFKVGFSERIRLTSWDNAIDLSDDIDTSATFTRVRTTLFGQWFPNEAFEVGVKLTNEFRYYLNPDDKDFTLDEVVFDQLYARLKSPFGSPLTFTLGRLNIILGEGFVMMDGTPLTSTVPASTGRSFPTTCCHFSRSISPKKTTCR